MAKKKSYNDKPVEELREELVKLRAALRGETLKMMQGKNIKEYRATRKDIARVLTAMHRSTNA